MGIERLERVSIIGILGREAGEVFGMKQFSGIFLPKMKET